MVFRLGSRMLYWRGDPSTRSLRSLLRMTYWPAAYLGTTSSLKAMTMLRSPLPKLLRTFDGCSMAVVTQIRELDNCSTIKNAECRMIEAFGIFRDSSTRTLRALGRNDSLYADAARFRLQARVVEYGGDPSTRAQTPLLRMTFCLKMSLPIADFCAYKVAGKSGKWSRFTKYI